MSNSETPDLTFSQRMGLTPIVKAAQIDSIDVALQNGLWNVLIDNYWSIFYHRDKYDRVKDSNFEGLIKSIYADFYKAAVDQIPYKWSACHAGIRKSFSTCHGTGPTTS